MEELVMASFLDGGRTLMRHRSTTLVPATNRGASEDCTGRKHRVGTAHAKAHGPFVEQVEESSIFKSQGQVGVKCQQLCRLDGFLQETMRRAGVVQHKNAAIDSVEVFRNQQERATLGHFCYELA